MKQTVLIVTCLLAILLATSARAASRQPDADSMLRLVVQAPDSVLLMLDSMERGGNAALPSWQADLIRGVAYNEKRMFSLVERYARRVLASDSVGAQSNEQLRGLTLLSVARAFFGDYNGSIGSSLEAIEIARATGNTAAEYNILTTMAKNSFSMGDREQGYSYIDRIISSGSESDEARVLANVSAAYGVKIVELYADEEFAEGLAEGRKRLALIDRIDRAGGSPEGFTDQQRAYAYARIASCAERLGRHDEARAAYDSFMATRYAANPVGRAYIMDYLLDSRQWRRVLESTAPLYPLFEQTDTINDDFHSLLVSDARAQSGLGNYRAGYDLLQRASAVKDSMYMRENLTRAQELATVFSLNEKELELERSKTALQRRHTMLIAAAGIAALIFAVLLLVWRAYRVARRNHRLAAKMVDELTALQPAEADLYGEDKENYKLFVGMQNKIIGESLFRDPAFNRDQIAEASGLSRANVIRLIDRFTGLSPNDYINKLRVEYSVKLIQEHPEWTIDAIAESSGYARRATYYSHFNKFFGITPAQYRRQKEKSPAEE